MKIVLSKSEEERCIALRDFYFLEHSLSPSLRAYPIIPTKKSFFISSLG